MHTAFQFPEVESAEFLAEFKTLMVEVAGDRAYEYRAAEKVEKLLVEFGLSIPSMEKAAAEQGFKRYSQILKYIELQMEILRGAASQWKGRDPLQMKTWPAWALVGTTTEGQDNAQDRWIKVGGRLSPPLLEVSNPNLAPSKMIALKTDPIWQRLGAISNFPDALGIDHPPFWKGSGLAWQTVEKIEAIAHGLMPSNMTQDATTRMIERHIEYQTRYFERLDASIKRSNDEYARRGD